MSFMTVVGKIFVCPECEKTVAVDYVGGPLATQIGDMAVAQQLEYSEHLGQPNTDPYEEGFYLYDFGVCGACYENLASAKDRKRYEQIFHLLGKIEAERSQAIDAVSDVAVDAIKSVALGLTLLDISKAIGSPVDARLGDKHATVDKKRRQISGFVQDYSNRIHPYILEKAFADGPVRQIVEQYREETKHSISQLSSLLDITQGKSYVQKHTNAAENLNAYIISNETVRYPVDDAIDEVFYYPIEYDVSELMHFLAIRPEDSGISVNLLIDKKQLCGIMERLTMSEQAH